MKQWILKNKLILIGALSGAVIGYGYYHFIGCTSGTCLISSRPLNSVAYFGLMGGLVLSIFKKGPKGNAN